MRWILRGRETNWALGPMRPELILPAVKKKKRQSRQVVLLSVRVHRKCRATRLVGYLVQQELNSSSRGKWKRRARLQGSRGQSSSLYATKRHATLALIDEESGDVEWKIQRVEKELFNGGENMVSTEAA